MRFLSGLNYKSQKAEGGKPGITRLWPSVAWRPPFSGTLVEGAAGVGGVEAQLPPSTVAVAVVWTVPPAQLLTAPLP